MPSPSATSTSSTPPPQLPPLDPSRQRLFQALKPPCVSLSTLTLRTSLPPPRDLTSALIPLLTTLHTISTTPDAPSLDSKLGDYVFFPLSYILKRWSTSNDRVLELTLLCLEQILLGCWRNGVKAEMARQVMGVVGFIIGGTPVEGNEAEVEDSQRSGETKLAGVKCLRALWGCLQRGKEEDRGWVEKREDLPAVAHVVTVLIDAVEKGGMVEVEVEGVKAIEGLVLGVVRDVDVRAGFFPGVVSGMVKIVGRGKVTKRQGIVLKEVVRLVDGIVRAVLGDCVVRGLPQEGEGGGLMDKQGKVKKVVRSKEWLKLTVENTRVAMEQILKLRVHPNGAVRRAVFELVRGLLEDCGESLKELVGSLVETMIVVSGDDDEALAGLAGNTLRVMAAMREDFKDAVKSALDKWISGLPRVMNGNDEDAKERVIGRLSRAFGFCEELGMETDVLRDMMAESVRESVGAAYALVKTGRSIPKTPTTKPRLEIAGIHEVGVTLQGLQNIQEFPDTMLPLRSQLGTVRSMKALLSQLGKSSSNALSLAQRHLQEVEEYGAPLKDRATALWIALNLIRGSVNSEAEVEQYFDFDFAEPNELRKYVTDELFSLALTQLSKAPDEDEEGSESGENDNVTLCCLALESLSLVAQTHKRAFRSDLVEALYPIVHHLGDPSPLVQNHAIICLNNITTLCEYSSAQELLLDNVDYMVNAVSLKLNIFDLSPQAPVVLTMMLKLVGPRLVPYLDDVVGSIFQVLEDFGEYEKLTEALFGVLAQVVEEGAKDDIKLIEDPDGMGTYETRHRQPATFTDSDLISWLKTETARKHSRSNPPPAGSDDVEELTPHRPWKRTTSPPPPDTSDPFSLPSADNDDELPPPPAPETSPLPKTYQTLEKISRLTQHYLPTPSLPLRIRLLHLLTTSTPPLAKNPNTFLPLLATLWPVLIQRLQDPEPSVVIAAAGAIGEVCFHAGDFAASRFSEAWEGVVKKVLVKADERRRREERGVGRLGMGWKVWESLVGCVKRVLEGVELRDECLDGVVEVLGEWVEEDEGLRGVLERVRPDGVWLGEMRRKWKGREWVGSVPRMEGVEWVVPVF